MAKKKKKDQPSKMKPPKKIKIKYKNIFLCLLILALITYGIYGLLHVRITNIYITGNIYLSDQYIIEKGHLSTYPSVLDTFPIFLKESLEKDPYIEKVTIHHKNIRELYITVTENRPLFYDATKEKTILKDGIMKDEKMETPTLLNYIPDKKYKIFLEKMKDIDVNIVRKISEIKYDPNDKDDERFLLSMNDGNYVYLTLGTFERINHYLNIMTQMSKKFNNQKGILYLDSGQYFQVLS